MLYALGSKSQYSNLGSESRKTCEINYAGSKEVSGPYKRNKIKPSNVGAYGA